MLLRRLLSRRGCVHALQRHQTATNVARALSTTAPLDPWIAYDNGATHFNFARDVFDRWCTPKPVNTAPASGSSVGSTNRTFSFASYTAPPFAHKGGEGSRSAFLWVDDHGNRLEKSFDDVRRDSCKAGNYLRSLGVGHGDLVMLVLPRYYDWWVLNLACLRIGAVLSPATVMLSPSDIQDRLTQSGACALLCNPATAAKLDEFVAQGNALPPTLKHRVFISEPFPEHAHDDVASLSGVWEDYRSGTSSSSDELDAADTLASEPSAVFFTSGTTGKPKMAVRTHASDGLGHRITGEKWLDLSPDDLHWNMSDTGWAKAAWSSFYAPWIQGSTVFVHHSYAKFSPSSTLALLQEHPITSLCSAPTGYRMFVNAKEFKDSKFSPKALRSCVSAGEPLNPEVIRAWEQATGLTIRDGFGQTETVLICGNFPGEKVKAGSMGKPAPGVPLEIVDADGNPCKVDEEGDLAVRVGPTGSGERPVFLFEEYRNDPQRTAKSHRGDFYLTGDLARKDSDGYIWFKARDDDVIITAAYRVGPYEVESALIEHPAVAESAVVGKPDEVRGQIVKAFVILAPGFKASDELAKELQDHVKSSTAPYKYPRDIEFVTELPKTVSGKIQRNLLRKRAVEECT